MAKKKGKWDDPADFDDLGGLSIDEPIADAIYIDTDEISREAKNDSMFMLKDLAKIYGNEKFMAEHPEYKKRLDLELESIRMLLKMRRSSEITHDILVKQIGSNPNNASMYKALQGLQKSLLDIQTKLDETVKTVNNLLKNYQLELPFDQVEETEDGETESISDHGASGLRYRGSRQFIIDMVNQKHDDQPTLFEDEEDAEEQDESQDEFPE